MPGLSIQPQTKTPSANQPKAAPKTTTTTSAKPLTLAQQAARLANQTVAAQVAAIQQQQTLETQRAQAQAAQINAASRGAAQFVQGMGTPVYNSYKDAATTLAGLSGGFSGALRDTAQTQADKVSADLNAVGSPAGAVNNAPALANVLYGMRGLQPASTLLNAGTAAASREAAVPQGLLGYGADLAAGALGAGRTAANNLTPQILDAQGKLPTLTTQYLNSLVNQASAQHKAGVEDALASSLITSRTNSANLNATKLSVQQKQFIAKYNQQAAQFNAKQTNAANKQALPNSAQSRLRGYIADGNGNMIPGADGKPQVLPGFTVKGGKIVKDTSATKAGKPLSLTTVNSLVKNWYSGTSSKQTDPTTGKTASTATGPVNYQRAYKMLTARGVTDQQARQALDAYYKRGQYGRAWLTNDEQAALKKFGRFTPAKVFQGHGYITPFQADALQKAGMLPAGEAGVINGQPVYYIAPD